MTLLLIQWWIFFFSTHFVGTHPLLRNVVMVYLYRGSKLQISARILISHSWVWTEEPCRLFCLCVNLGLTSTLTQR